MMLVPSCRARAVVQTASTVTVTNTPPHPVHDAVLALPFKEAPYTLVQVAESMAQLLEIVVAFEEALDPAAGRRGEAELAPVLAAALEPLLDMCERSAEALSVDHPSRRGAFN